MTTPPRMPRVNIPLRLWLALIGTAVLVATTVSLRAYTSGAIRESIAEITALGNFSARQISQVQREALRLQILVAADPITTVAVGELELQHDLVSSRVTIVSSNYRPFFETYDYPTAAANIATEWTALQPTWQQWLQDRDNPVLRAALQTELGAFERNVNQVEADYTTAVNRRLSQYRLLSQRVQLAFYLSIVVMLMTFLTLAWLFRRWVMLQRQTSQLLFAANQRYIEAAAAGAVGTWQHTFGRPYFVADPPLQRLLGQTWSDNQLPMRHILRMHDKASRHAIRQMSKGILEGQNEQFEIEHEVSVADGAKRWLLTRGRVLERVGNRPVTISGTSTDVTERRLAQAAIERSQRMESVGLLAGGIAHDFNNLLTSIMTQIALAQRKAPMAKPSVVQRHLSRAHTASEQAARLTRQLLSFAGKGQQDVVVLDLNAAVSENEALFDSAVPRGASLQLNLCSDPCPVEADRSQIQQALMNLVINACDALPAQNGLVEITTCLTEITPSTQLDSSLMVWGELQPGHYSFYRVRDNGMGVSPQVQAQIFEPFFSTKQSGRGLGLAATLGVVTQLGGAITLQSRPDIGSEFTLYFPISDKHLTRGTEPTRPFKLPLNPGVVLIIDDDVAVRQALADALASLQVPYKVAVNGADGMALMKAQTTPFAVAIVDVVMPVMDGPATMRAIREYDHDVSIIVATGYSRNYSLETFAEFKPAGVLYKPFTLEALVALLATAFEQQKQAATTATAPETIE